MLPISKSSIASRTEPYRRRLTTESAAAGGDLIFFRHFPANLRISLSKKILLQRPVIRPAVFRNTLPEGKRAPTKQILRIGVTKKKTLRNAHTRKEMRSHHRLRACSPAGSRRWNVAFRVRCCKRHDFCTHSYGRKTKGDNVF